MRDGLFPAMRVDPVVLRAFLRMFNLLEPPDSLMKDADVDGPRHGGLRLPRRTPARGAHGPARDRVLELLGAGPVS